MKLSRDVILLWGMLVVWGMTAVAALAARFGATSASTVADWVMAGLSFCGFIFSLASAVLLYLTFEATRESVKIAAGEAARLREEAELRNRPWVAITDLSARIEAETSIQALMLDATLKNFGTLPAKFVCVECTVGVLNKEDFTAVFNSAATLSSETQLMPPSMERQISLQSGFVLNRGDALLVRLKVHYQRHDGTTVPENDVQEYEVKRTAVGVSDSVSCLSSSRQKLERENKVEPVSYL